MRRAISGWMTVLCALAAMLGPVRSSCAQWDGYEPQFTSAQLEDAIKSLELDLEQRDIARSLHEGYMSDHTRAVEQMKAYMEEIQRIAEATQNWEIWQETSEVWVDFQQYTRKIRDNMTTDLKMVLREDQMARWDRLERKFRRDQEINQNYYLGFISGAKVDLVSVLATAEVPQEVLDSIDSEVNTYEIELDRMLVDTREFIDEWEKKARDGFDFEQNMEEMTKVYGRGMELVGGIRDLNKRHADKIQTLLPEDIRGGFRAAFNEQAYPDIYKTNKVSVAIERSLGMADLRDDQRERLGIIKEQYERELSKANERWAEAKVRYESERTILSWQNGDEEPDWLTAARELRERLDERTIEKIESVLTGEQVERLPGRGKQTVERPVFGS